MNDYLKIKLLDYKINFTLRPETYKTILKGEFGFNTKTTKLRKKLSKLVKEQHISNIPINNILRGRDVIFFIDNKEYYILFANNDCYYCDDIESDGNYLYTKIIFKLNNNEWIKIKDKKFNHSEVSLCL